MATWNPMEEVFDLTPGPTIRKQPEDADTTYNALSALLRPLWSGPQLLTNPTDKEQE